MPQVLSLCGAWQKFAKFHFVIYCEASRDFASRLGSLAHDMAGTAYDVTYGYSYNAAGQIASTTRSNDVYAYAHTNRDEASTINGLNQATSVGGATLAYDARGNLTDPGGTAYTFDTRNQLYTDGTHLLYRGPGGLLGQEIWGPEQHAFDHARGQLATEFGYGNGGQFRRFVYGPGTDEPLVWYEGSGTTDRRWLHADERGSIVAVSDASGTVTAVNTYDEHGVPGTGNTGRLQYTGQMWLPAVALYDYKARMYAPRLGRFLQTDPIGYGDGMNWYGYVGGDPVNLVDPSGTLYVCPDSNPDNCYYVVTNQNLREFYQNYRFNPSPCITTSCNVETPSWFPAAALPPQTVTCSGPARVMAGNPKTVGKVGGMLKSIERGSAAVVPRQFPGGGSSGRASPYLRSIGPNVYGSTAGGQSFNGVDDVINDGEIAPTAKQAQDIEMARDPSRLLIELVTGNEEGRTRITITVPGAICPANTAPVRGGK